MEKTKDILLSLYKKYPLSEIQDFYKAVYQSVCGCGHLVGDSSAAADYISRESSSATVDDIESLGKYSRVYLGQINDGLSPLTLAKLFSLSAVVEDKADTSVEMDEKLSVLMDMIKLGKIGLDYIESESYVSRMRESGYPACHHSEKYRELYSPAYRLLKTEYAKFIPAFRLIDRLMAEKDRVIVAVDGTSAGGKTTFSSLLAEVYDCNVFHMDDFFLREEQRTPERYAEAGGNVDRERFLDEVLLPLSKGLDVNYRKFDCKTFTVLSGETIPAKKLSIVEGAYSMHPSLAGYYDASVFVCSSPEIQRERIIKRNGDMAERFFNEWIPLENRYFEAFDIREKCDLVIETE